MKTDVGGFYGESSIRYSYLPQAICSHLAQRSISLNGFQRFNCGRSACNRCESASCSSYESAVSPPWVRTPVGVQVDALPCVLRAFRARVDNVFYLVENNPNCVYSRNRIEACGSRRDERQRASQDLSICETHSHATTPGCEREEPGVRWLALVTRASTRSLIKLAPRFRPILPPLSSYWQKEYRTS